MVFPKSLKSMNAGSELWWTSISLRIVVLDEFLEGSWSIETHSLASVQMSKLATARGVCEVDGSNSG